MAHGRKMIQADTSEKWHALVAADNVVLLSDLLINVPIEKEKLRGRLERLRDRLAIEAAEEVLKAWGRR